MNINNKKIGLSIILLGMIIIFSDTALGFGIMPASQTIIAGENTQEVSFYVVNDNIDIDLFVRVEGELSNFVDIENEKISLLKNQDREKVKLRLKKLPQNIEPGEHIIKIVLLDITKNEGHISAKITLTYKLKIVVPYDDAYLDISLYAPNFKKDEGGNFIIQAQNKGAKNAINAIPIIDIYSQTNNKIATIKGDSKLIKKGEMANFALPLNEDLQNGKYFAKASMLYSGQSNSDEKTFTVGSPEIIIDDISTSTFKLGGIAGFDILLINNWGEELNVFADIEFKKENENLWETTTSTTKIEGMSRGRLQAFWDTSGLPAGTYDMIINLNYLDKKDTTNKKIRLETDKVSVIGTGKVIKDKEDTNETLTLLIIVIFILALLNALFVYKFVLKNKTKKK